MLPKQTKLSFIAIFVILLSARLTAPPAYACTPTPPSQGAPPTVAERVNAADLVVLGTVTEVLNESGYEPAAMVQVERYFKSAGDDSIEIAGFGDGSVCRRRVEVGDRLIFYVTQYPDGSLHAHWLTAFEAVAAPTDDLIMELETAVGISADDLDSAPPPPTADVVSPTITPMPPTAVRPVEPSPETSNSPLLAATAILLASIALITAVFWYRSRGK